jgi:tRNA nucleotidyltransferase (CCA-adding enzyme)
LDARLRKTLPPALHAILRRAVELSAEHGWRIYLAGGSVRDLLLRRPNYDVDVAVEGDAPALGALLQRESGSRLEVAERFGTAGLAFPGSPFDLDLVTARRESYEYPGALPTVAPGDIYDDMARRDFTVNAIALPLTPDGVGAPLDPHGGLADLDARLIRVMHDRSFIDDPTRIFRAVKYAFRLGFKIELHTLELILQAVRDGAPATVSTDRSSRELLLIMEEPEAPSMLAYLDKLGVLRALHPDLAWPYSPESAIHPRETAELTPRQRRDTYLAILGAEFAGFAGEAESLGRALGLEAPLVRLMRDAAQLAGIWQSLGDDTLSPSQIYRKLHRLDLVALHAYARVEALRAQTNAWDRLCLYLDTLRHVKPELDGNYLRSLGVAPGPPYKRVLEKLMDAKLDGKVPARRDEEQFVEELLREEGLPG